MEMGGFAETSAEARRTPIYSVGRGPRIWEVDGRRELDISAGSEGALTTPFGRSPQKEGPGSPRRWALVWMWFGRCDGRLPSSALSILLLGLKIEAQ